MGCDPGKGLFSVGIADENGFLLFAKTYDKRKHAKRFGLHQHELAMLMAQEVHEDTERFRCTVAVYEDQYINTHGGGKGDPNDMLRLGFNNGAIATALQMALWGQHRYMQVVRLIAPQDWKGNIDADMFTRRIEDSLTPGEKTNMVHKNHNTYDAAGLAKWAASRRNFLVRRSGA